MRKLEAALPVATGAVAYIAADNLGSLSFLVFVCLVPLLLSLKYEDGRGAWKRGYLFGFVFGLGELFWLGQITEKWVHSWGLGMVPWLVATVLMALYFGLFAILAQRAIIAGRGWAVPIIWSGMEVFRSYIPVLAFPWALLSEPLWRSPWLIQTAHVGTIYLVSAWVAAINWLVARTIEDRKNWKPLAVVAAGGCAISLALYAINPPTRPLRVAIGQTGVDMAFNDRETAQALTDRAVASIVGYARRSRAGLLVLPEDSTQELVEGGPVQGFRLDSKIPTVVGAQRGTGPFYQSAVGYDGKWQSTDKTRLVIFGEFVPGRDVLPFLKVFNLPSGDLSAGTNGVRAIRFHSLTVGPIVCFEELFPDITYKQSMNGSNLLAVLSIDDWFVGTSAPQQLMCSSVWRAIETGLPLVRATPLGDSLAVDLHGRFIRSLPQGNYDPETVTVPIPQAPFAPFWLPVYPVLALLASVVLPFLKPKDARR